MATLYYNPTVDTAWDTLENWWTDVAFSDPALALPADGDDVYLAALMETGPSVSVTLNHIYVADASTGGGGFYANFSGAIGDATFNSGSFNRGSVTGDATFNDNGDNLDGTVSGNATFNGGSLNQYGVVSGDATFNDNSYNGAIVSGNATFNDNSFNAGTVSGTATYNGYTGWIGWLSTYFVKGEATTLPDSGTGVFNGTYYQNGQPAQIPTDFYYNAAADTAWDTVGNWWADAAFTTSIGILPVAGSTVYLAAQMDSGPSVSVTLNHIYVADASTGGGSFYANFSGAIGDATFNDFSNNNYGTVSGNATFNDSSYNYGTVTGNATFNDSSYSTAESFGAVYGNATFNDSSYNYGIVSRDATFNDNSYNINAVYGNATFNDSSYTNGTVFGNATFNDNSYNNGNNGGGTVTGNATFNDPYTYNNGIVGGNATFYGFYGNSGTCSSDAFFNDATTNIGTVTGKSTFSLTAAVSQIKTYSGTTQGTFSGEVIITSGGSGSGTTPNAINLGQLIGLPPFIQI